MRTASTSTSSKGACEGSPLRGFKKREAQHLLPQALRDFVWGASCWREATQCLHMRMRSDADEAQPLMCKNYVACAAGGSQQNIGFGLRVLVPFNGRSWP